jgi:hypothetical protein
MPRHVKFHSTGTSHNAEQPRVERSEVPASGTAASAPKSDEEAKLVRPLAILSAQEYGIKVFEFAYANATAALQYAEKLSRVKTPAEYFAVCSEHSRRQVDLLSRQGTQLLTIAQNAVVPQP